MSDNSRELGLYERFSLSRSLAGIHPIVSFIATVTDLPMPQQLEAVISRLMGVYPLLCCCIPVVHTRHPRFSYNTNIESSDIIRYQFLDSTNAELLLKELHEGKDFDLSSGPLWRVTVYETSSAPRLALTFNHTLSDGLSGRNLLSQLLQQLSLDDEKSALSKLPFSTNLPPSLESSIDMNAHIEHQIRNEKLENQCWPNPPPVPPYTRDMRVAVIQLPADLIPKMKANAVEQGVHTLHPVLHAIAVASLASAVETTPLNIHTSAPSSQRDASRGHPHVTGNYVGGFSFVYHPLERYTRFWQIAKEYAAARSDPAALEASKRVMNFLKDLPDPEPMPTPDKTGWELLIEQALKAENPYRVSLELSNVGVLQEEVAGLHEVVFAQTPNPVNAALTLQLVSTRNGPLSISVVWRDAAVEDSTVDKMLYSWQEIAARVGDGKISEGTTLAEL